jgi:hypothetical protein
MSRMCSMSIWVNAEGGRGGAVRDTLSLLPLRV